MSKENDTVLEPGQDDPEPIAKEDAAPKPDGDTRVTVTRRYIHYTDDWDFTSLEDSLLLAKKYIGEAFGEDDPELAMVTVSIFQSTEEIYSVIGGKISVSDRYIDLVKKYVKGVGQYQFADEKWNIREEK